MLFDFSADIVYYLSENAPKRINKVPKRAQYLIAVNLIVCLAAGPVLAATNEAMSTAEAAAPNYLQEVDVIFWQTLPFAALWGHVFERQLSSFMFPGSAAHWEAIMAFAVVVSATNAMLHARRVVSDNSVEKTR